MNLTTQIQSNFPKTIDKTRSLFSSLVANKNQDAVIQKQIIDLLAYMKEWISTPDIYEQTGKMLLKTVNFFSYLEPFSDESEKSLKNRFAAIFIRKHDTKWGTPFDIIHVFRQYFTHANIYLVENTNPLDTVNPELANLFSDGDITTLEPDGWTLTNCTVDSDARFSKTYGIKFAQPGGILSSDTLTVNSSATYFLHFFMKGKINVQIENNVGSFWNNKTKEWDSASVDNVFETSDWDNKSMYFITDELTESVTVRFKYVDTLTYCDYFRLFAKQNYGSFTVIAQFEGTTAENVFGLAGGDADPYPFPQPRYSNYGYYDKSFLSGIAAGYAKDIYEDLLVYLKAQGVQATLEIVNKDFIEE
ncbi:MAG: hypothetical protein IJL34_04105 [Treponema sp.]|nr:hypothetical protein [Treponema sp.]